MSVPKLVLSLLPQPVTAPDSPIRPLLNLTVKELSAYFVQHATDKLYADNNFWRHYYHLHYSSTYLPVLHNCYNGQSIDYRAAVMWLDMDLNEDTSPAEAIQRGLDSYIIRHHLTIQDSNDMLELAIISGTVGLLKLFNSRIYSVKHLKLARDYGRVDMYLYIHDELLKHGMLEARVDSTDVLFTICCVYDDVIAFDAYVTSSDDYYKYAMQAGATRILSRLKQ